MLLSDSDDETYVGHITVNIDTVLLQKQNIRTDCTSHVKRRLHELSDFEEFTHFKNTPHANKFYVCITME
jgi:hypothetical protein